MRFLEHIRAEEPIESFFYVDPNSNRFIIQSKPKPKPPKKVGLQKLISEQEKLNDIIWGGSRPKSAALAIPTSIPSRSNSRMAFSSATQSRT